MFFIESTMYELTKLFLAPVLLIILALFGYAFYTLGGFALEWWQRSRPGYVSPLVLHQRRTPGCGLEDLELWIMHRLEILKLTTRTAPMLGLVATMIPMGPALLSLSDGNARGVGENLVVAFGAVIIALIAASLTFVVLTVRRRWLLTELRAIEQGMKKPAPAAVPASHTQPALQPLAAKRQAAG
ncbi:MotA/TolQ/ExbB proton channel family protein [Geoalkalibacter halelectricus]|uniref:MotA/TolQ/ExbB proton channel family protein n=1 Tax=Geoalkalibacter halelectricus TaxID=2847045 RepID=UPI002670B9B0|nr:MotA/TolQ/ExbB proton channel family protein [Geoalkalibacter halelectricus]MDO3380323.1 MotA/TolQ/ExbB proton channel family protein [Geoalkalibacter halelectricus]